MGHRICTGETALSGKNNRKTEEKQLKKLIIIPAYNEEANIVKTVESIERDAVGFDYIVINDCSTDRTKEICEEHGFHYVDLPINLGIGGAVQTGYKYAWENGYDMAVQVDGDGQHDPEFLELMAEYLETYQVDMVIGSRFIEKQGFQSSGMRRVGIRFFSGLIRLMTGKTITDPTSGLRMAGRNVIELFSKDYPRDYPEPESVVAILRKGLKVAEVPVIMREREGGVSSISMKKSVYYMVKVTLAILIERIRR
ncbi:glycosyltransferase family 2 protein [Mediterraneibacter glycyrrhizinilyticus]